MYIAFRRFCWLSNQHIPLLEFELLSVSFCSHLHFLILILVATIWSGLQNPSNILVLDCILCNWNIKWTLKVGIYYVLGSKGKSFSDSFPSNKWVMCLNFNQENHFNNAVSFFANFECCSHTPWKKSWIKVTKFYGWWLNFSSTFLHPTKNSPMSN